MKKTAITLILTATALIGTGFSASAQTKIGTVDMNKIFSGYYKTKDAEARINAARAKAKQELDDKMDELKKGEEELKKIQDDFNNPALSKEAKEEKAKAFEEKRNKMAPQVRELQEYRATQEKQLQEQAVRMRNGIVEEIQKIITAKVESEQFDLVFDRSGNSLNGVPILVYAKDALDFSDSIITQLNKNKPKDAPEGGASGDGALKLQQATPEKK